MCLSVIYPHGRGKPYDVSYEETRVEPDAGCTFKTEGRYIAGVRCVKQRTDLGQ
jgi:hypothetical protein